MNLANQANYMQGFFGKIVNNNVENEERDKKRGGNRKLREGMERKQISNAFLGWLHHKTVIDLIGSTKLL